jgi:hypothetical protein
MLNVFDLHFSIFTLPFLPHSGEKLFEPLSCGETLEVFIARNNGSVEKGYWTNGYIVKIDKPQILVEYLKLDGASRGRFW